MALEPNTIHQGDCVARLQQVATGAIDLVFADPPFNIGYKYDVYQDQKESAAYLDWTRQWMAEVFRALKGNGAFWLAIGDEYAAELKLIATDKLGLHCRSWVIWYYTFGVNCTQNFSRSHTHLFHFVKNPSDFTFNDHEIRVPSARQLVYADARANPEGRLPDNTWVLRPQDLTGGFCADEDTWYFPRVAGTFKERAGFHGCQMPEQLLGRIIRTCSNPGETVLDPFAGSGSTLVVAKKLGRRWMGFELSKDYAKRASNRVKQAYEGQPLDGAIEPVASAPPTRKRFGPAYLRAGVRRALVEAFVLASKGFSVDRVLADPSLNSRFLLCCKRFGLPGDAASCNRALLALRKGNKLRHLAPAKRTTVSDLEMDQYTFASEMALRRMQEQSLSLDEILCDPTRRVEFTGEAELFAPGFSTFQYLWAALSLRKRAMNSRRNAKALAPKLKAQDFDSRSFRPLFELSLHEYRQEAGVYLARTLSAKNLYLGETFDLGQRLSITIDTIDSWGEKADEIQLAILPLEGVTLAQRFGLQSRLIGKYKPNLNYLPLGLA